MKITKKKLAKRIVIIVLCVILAVYIIGSFIAVKYMYKENFGRADVSEFSGYAYLRYSDFADKYDRKTVQFDSGENKLTGYIYGSGDKGIVVVSHGLGGYSESYICEDLYFVDKGYRVLGFDNTGSGSSEGKGTMGMSQSIIDLDSALDYIESDDELKDLPILLYGHSWGGYAVAAALGTEHDITASASVSGYDTPLGIVLEFGRNSLGTPVTVLETPFIWLNEKLTFGKNANKSAVEAINSSDTPILIIHGTDDEVVTYGGSSIISHKDEITNPNAQFKVMDGKGHNDLFLTDESWEYISEKNEEYRKLREQYDGEIPYDVELNYYKNIDKNKTNVLSEDFMNEIDDFYTNALSGGKTE